MCGRPCRHPPWTPHTPTELLLHSPTQQPFKLSVTLSEMFSSGKKRTLRWADSSQPPFLIKLRSSKWLIGVTAFFAAFTVSFCILPSLPGDADAKAIGWLPVFHSVHLRQTDSIHLAESVQVVPVLPFSLVDRSGISEDDGERPCANRYLPASMS